MATKLTRQRSLFQKVILPSALLVVAGIIGYMGVEAMQKPKKEIEKNKCAGICVALKNNRMEPEELAVKVGTYIQFNTEDGLKHNISLGDGADNHDPHADIGDHDHTDEYKSGEFGPGEAWRVQFKQRGTYKLHDHYHPNQRILIVVY